MTEQTGPKNVARRAGWGVADQAFSSLTNFAVGASVARTLGPATFGAFSLAFATYLLLLNVSRAITTEPLVVRFGATDEVEWRRGTSAATGASLVVGVLGGSACILAGMALNGALGTSLIAMGISLPGLLLQDAWRFCFVARKTPSAAFVNDLLWAAVLFPAIAVLIASGRGSVLTFGLAWGGGAAVGAVAGIFQSSLLVPAPQKTGAWFTEQQDLAPRYLGELLAMSGSGQLLLYGVGVVASLTAVGAIRGAQIILGLPYVFIMGIRIMAIPEAASLYRSSPERLRSGVWKLAVAMIAVVAVCGLGASIVPNSLGKAIFSRSWRPAHALLFPVTVWLAGFAGQIAALVGLRAVASARRSLYARLISGVTMVVLAVGGAKWGASGAAWGQALGTWIGVGVWWYHFLRALEEGYLRERKDVTLGTPGPVGVLLDE